MSGKATLAELNTIYGIEDLYDLLEIIAVEQHNERAIAAWEEKQKRRG